MLKNAGRRDCVVHLCVSGLIDEVRYTADLLLFNRA